MLKLTEGRLFKNAREFSFLSWDWMHVMPLLTLSGKKRGFPLTSPGDGQSVETLLETACQNILLRHSQVRSAAPPVPSTIAQPFTGARWTLRRDAPGSPPGKLPASARRRWVYPISMKMPESPRGLLVVGFTQVRRFRPVPNPNLRPDSQFLCSLQRVFYFRS